MKPVAIFRHYHSEGPGYLATYLERHGLRWEIVRIDANDPIPHDPSGYAGLAFMGGPMSVNDPLPWIEPVLDLIRSAKDREVPVLGHCLGGQLMARALGGSVGPNPCREIGWGDVDVVPGEVSGRWFGSDRGRFTTFHWHGETFTIPPGATRILSSADCPNQAFALGRHLGLQCHVEMTPELVAAWARSGAREIAAHPGPAVQTPEQMQENLCDRLAALHAVADRLYARWVEGLAD